MTEDKKERDFLKAYEISSENNGSNAKTASGQYRFLLLLAFLFLGIAMALFIFRILSVKFGTDLKCKNSGNPLFHVGKDEKPEDKPLINGARVYDIREDTGELEKDIEYHQKEFAAELNEIKKQENISAEMKLMEQKDHFAAERLKLLKQIDQAETREKRLQAIKELKEMTGGEN